MAPRPLAARFVVYLSCLAAGILHSATRFASAAAPQPHQEERQLQPHEVAERCRAATGFPLVKDVSRPGRTDGGLLKNGLLKSAVLHFTRDLPEGEQLTSTGAPKLVDREYRREYSLDEFQIIVPPEEQEQHVTEEVPEEEAECDGGEKEPQPHEEALAEMAGNSLLEELWVLLGALDRRLHLLLLEKPQWFDFVGDPSLNVQDDSLGRADVTGEETAAGLRQRDCQMFAAQFSALRGLLGEQIARGYEDTATARLRQLRELAMGVEALSKRIDLQEQLEALEGLPRVVAGTGYPLPAWSALEVEAQAGVSPPLLLTHKMGISIQNVSKFVQLFRAGDCDGLGVHEVQQGNAVSFLKKSGVGIVGFIQPASRRLTRETTRPVRSIQPTAMPYLVDGDGRRLEYPIEAFRYVFPEKARNVDVLSVPGGSYLTRDSVGSAPRPSHQTVVSDLLRDVQEAEARVAKAGRHVSLVELPVLVAALCQTWRKLHRLREGLIHVSTGYVGGGGVRSSFRRRIGLRKDVLEEIKNFGDGLDEILTQLKEHILIHITSREQWTVVHTATRIGDTVVYRSTAPPVNSLLAAPEQEEEQQIGALLTQPSRLLRLAALASQLLRLQRQGDQRLHRLMRLRPDLLPLRG